METEKIVIKNSDEWDWRYAPPKRWNEFKNKLIKIEGFHKGKGILKLAYEDKRFHHSMGLIMIPGRGEIPHYLGGTTSVTIYPEEERILWVLLNT